MLVKNVARKRNKHPYNIHLDVKNLTIPKKHNKIQKNTIHTDGKGEK